MTFTAHIKRTRELLAKATPEIRENVAHCKECDLPFEIYRHSMGCSVPEEKIVTHARNNLGRYLDALEKAVEEIRQIKDDTDCDEDAHRYLTICWRCDCEKTLTEINALFEGEKG